MMKQKKIIVPILTLAVMLLMVGGVYAVFSSTQPEKSKAENVRDTTDQDYEKGLTEEQKAFNELINKQIYEETANITVCRVYLSSFKSSIGSPVISKIAD